MRSPRDRIKGDRIMGIEKKKKIYEERLWEVIKKFTVNDIERIIREEIKAAGLLAMPVFAGMISFGHFLYGFEQDDRDVFLKFSRYRMKIDRKLGEILYDNVYAGLITEWCAKSRVTLYAGYANIDSEWLWEPRKNGSTGININAVRLALLYLSAVEQLQYSKTSRHRLEASSEKTIILRKQIDAFLSEQQEVQK